MINPEVLQGYMIAEEGQNIDATKILFNQLDLAFKTGKEAKTLKLKGNRDEARNKYLEAAKLCFDVAEEIDKTDPSLLSTILGWIAQKLKSIIVASLTFGIGGIKAAIDDLTTIINSIKAIATGTFTVTNLNNYIESLKNDAWVVGKAFENEAKKC